MRNSLFLQFAALAILTSGAVSVRVQENNMPPPGFTALFNGKDLSGWHGMGHFDPRALWAMSDEDRQKKTAAERPDFVKHWTIDNGELVNDGEGGYATTDKEYGDIDLWIDYKTVAKADSGIYLCVTPQVQIWDYTREGGKWNLGADKGSGGLWNNKAGAAGKDPRVLADKPFGEWNRFRIRQIGDRTSVWLNGQHLVDDAPLENYWEKMKPPAGIEVPKPLANNSQPRPLFAKGPIQLQTHGGEIRWKNIFLREIPSDEALLLLRGQEPEGFALVFDGKSFDGWAGAVENYEIVDGSIRCKTGKGGTLYTKEVYDDFIVRVEFKLPAGGNNGLAIRYPGSGDPAYSAMCELQVLDTEHPQYQKQLDSLGRQGHGSAYGMIAAHRGYLRPVGQWNYEQVTVKGSTIKVELNGVTILDGDLSKVTEFMADKAHPGKDLKSGHFGFAGHNDPVEFRNISIKRLNPAGG